MINSSLKRTDSFGSIDLSPESVLDDVHFESWEQEKSIESDPIDSPELRQAMPDRNPQALNTGDSFQL